MTPRELTHKEPHAGWRACARWWRPSSTPWASALASPCPRARTYWGLLTRLGAKIAAFNLAVYVNHLFNRPTFAIFDPLG